ncbi:unnamed protein product, partial [Polarella glacialis]
DRGAWQLMSAVPGAVAEEEADELDELELSQPGAAHAFFDLVHGRRCGEAEASLRASARCAARAADFFDTCRDFRRTAPPLCLPAGGRAASPPKRLAQTGPCLGIGQRPWGAGGRRKSPLLSGSGSGSGSLHLARIAAEMGRQPPIMEVTGRAASAGSGRAAHFPLRPHSAPSGVQSPPRGVQGPARPQSALLPQAAFRPTSPSRSPARPHVSPHRRPRSPSPPPLPLPQMSLPAKPSVAEAARISAYLTLHTSPHKNKKKTGQPRLLWLTNRNPDKQSSGKTRS